MSRPEWENCSLFENSLTDLSDEEFMESLDAFNAMTFAEVLESRTYPNWCARYLVEAERRWRPKAK